MNRKEYDEIKQATAKILKEFGILTNEDFNSADEDTMCELYENLKAGILEEFDVEEEEMNKILDDILS